jgi:predicted nucleic acid-binding protein
LAIENENSLLIIDERKGRLVAKRMGLSIIGTLGVIIKAKENGIIETIKPILEKLEMVQFRISPKLKKQILDKVGENG